MKIYQELADKLIENGELTHDEYVKLFELLSGALEHTDQDSSDQKVHAWQIPNQEVTTHIAATQDSYAQLRQNITSQLGKEAVRLRRLYYGDKVYVRGLIEFSNFCKNNCYYCGIQRENHNIQRYRLSTKEILQCCAQGYELGFRTFVLQSGEDPYYTDDRMTEIIRKIRENYPDCAITLSIGEKSEESYARYKEAGADRYLLRHETANEEHYGILHPAEMSLKNRKNCLATLKKLGYQVGAGFMVGSPGQRFSDLADDMIYLKELQPHMVGIGPFIPHHDTRFKNQPAGSVPFTIALLSVVRIILPKVLLPATTALGSVDPLGREKGLMAGANVVMPNLSPSENRKLYELYDNKICSSEDAGRCQGCMERRIAMAGYEMVTDRGDAVI